MRTLSTYGKAWVPDIGSSTPLSQVDSQAVRCTAPHLRSSLLPRKTLSYNDLRTSRQILQLRPYTATLESDQRNAPSPQHFSSNSGRPCSGPRPVGNAGRVLRRIPTHRQPGRWLATTNFGPPNANSHQHRCQRNHLHSSGSRLHMVVTPANAGIFRRSNYCAFRYSLLPLTVLTMGFSDEFGREAALIANLLDRAVRLRPAGRPVC